MAYLMLLDLAWQSLAWQLPWQITNVIAMFENSNVKIKFFKYRRD